MMETFSSQHTRLFSLAALEQAACLGRREVEGPALRWERNPERLLLQAASDGSLAPLDPE